MIFVIDEMRYTRELLEPIEDVRINQEQKFTWGYTATAYEKNDSEGALE